MTKIALKSGFVFDVTNLYGPDNVTAEDVKELEPIYTKAHETLMETIRNALWHWKNWRGRYGIA